jgi:hypothetical protein
MEFMHVLVQRPACSFWQAPLQIGQSFGIVGAHATEEVLKRNEIMYNNFAGPYAFAFTSSVSSVSCFPLLLANSALNSGGLSCSRVWILRFSTL